jgi:hypothetical protein
MRSRRYPENPDALWITEVWNSQASHAASLTLASVQHAIARARPLIAGFSDRVVTTPVGGIGLSTETAGNEVVVYAVYGRTWPSR